MNKEKLNNQAITLENHLLKIISEYAIIRKSKIKNFELLDHILILKGDNKFLKWQNGKLLKSSFYDENALQFYLSSFNEYLKKYDFYIGELEISIEKPKEKYLESTIEQTFQFDLTKLEKEKLISPDGEENIKKDPSIKIIKNTSTDKSKQNDVTSKKIKNQNKILAWLKKFFSIFSSY